MKRAKWFFLVPICFLLFSEQVFGEDSWRECGWKNWACFAGVLLPRNENGSNQVDTDQYHEWAAYQGHVYGSGKVIEFRLRFDGESLRTLGETSLFQPFALEVDISEANDGTRLKFGKITHTFPTAAKAVQDVSASNDINPNKNADGLLVRDARAIESYKDYFVWFHLKEPLPSDGVEVVPALQISYNTHYLRLASELAGILLPTGIPSIKAPSDSPWNFFPLEADNYVKGWKLYPDGREGLVWGVKATSRKETVFYVDASGKVYDSVQLSANKRYDRLDQLCRAYKPDPGVEQFRNAMTGRITIYRTPEDSMGRRYNDPECNTEGFPLLSGISGDSNGSGATNGSESAQKPNLVAKDTFVTYGESASSQKIASSDHVFLGTPIWCQMRMGNDGSADVTRYFDSACYLSVGEKFDGWDSAKNLGLVRTSSLKKGDTHTEHKGIDILTYPDWYNVVSKIDTNNVIVETNERDNSYNKDNPFAFQVWGRPSIAVGVNVNKASYDLGESVFATAQFSNIGAHPFGKTAYVDWYVDGAIVESETDSIQRENLRPGTANKAETATFSLPQTYGKHEIKACFRFGKDDFVEEIDPSDNCAVTEVSFPDPNPPVVVEAPSPPPEETNGDQNDDDSSSGQDSGSDPTDPNGSTHPPGGGSTRSHTMSPGTRAALEYYLSVTKDK